jgi:hypothetical protein
MDHIRLPLYVSGVINHTKTGPMIKVTTATERVVRSDELPRLQSIGPGPHVAGQGYILCCTFVRSGFRYRPWGLGRFGPGGGGSNLGFGCLVIELTALTRVDRHEDGVARG